MVTLNLAKSKEMYDACGKEQSQAAAESPPFSPISFLQAMWNASDIFAGYEQQDAQEEVLVLVVAVVVKRREGGGTHNSGQARGRVIFY